MSDAPFDLRYASRDEHFALRERVAVLETQVLPALIRIETKLAQPPPAPATTSLDNLSLAIQRMMDAPARTSGGKAPGWSLVAALSLVAMFAGYKAIFG